MAKNDPKYACNKVISEFWDDTPENRKQAIEISHQMLKKSLSKKKKGGSKKK